MPVLYEYEIYYRTQYEVQKLRVLSSKVSGTI